jgi:hypothetical protein
LKSIEGEVLNTNRNMLKLMTRLGFSMRASDEDQAITKVSKEL